MNIAEKPIAAIIGHLTSTGDGVHMIANKDKKGVRLDTHMHREAQLVYAAKGTMQVTTPTDIMEAPMPRKKISIMWRRLQRSPSQPVTSEPAPKATKPGVA